MIFLKEYLTYRLHLSLQRTLGQCQCLAKRASKMSFKLSSCYIDQERERVLAGTDAVSYN